MKLKWYGHSCFEITLNNGIVLVTDPFDASVGYPLCGAETDAALVSHGHFDHNAVDTLKGSFKVFDSEGAWDFEGAGIAAVHSFHDDAQGSKRGDNLIFTVEADGVKLAHLGDLGHIPDTAAQDKALSGLDIMLIPIGGFYTIDTNQAVEIIRKYRPKTAVAMHFANSYCHFPVSDDTQFIRLTNAGKLPNTVENVSELPEGCYVMELP